MVEISNTYDSKSQLPWTITAQNNIDNASIQTKKNKWLESTESAQAIAKTEDTSKQENTRSFAKQDYIEITWNSNNSWTYSPETIKAKNQTQDKTNNVLSNEQQKASDSFTQQLLIKQLTSKNTWI